MLLRSRKSRIYFLRKFFEYPITLSAQTIRNLGVARTLKIGLSYLRVAAVPSEADRQSRTVLHQPLRTRAL